MYLGNTTEEKIASMDELTKRARKLGNLFKIVGIFGGIIMIFTGLVAEGSIFTKLFLIVIAIICPIAYYACGYIWYWGFITVKSWFVKYDVSSRSLVSAAGTSIAVSYLIGGKKTAETLLAIMLIIMSLVLTIGWWVGLFRYFTLKKEIASLTA